jgi:hypothetical protein
MPKPTFLTTLAWLVRVAIVGMLIGLLVAIPHDVVFVELPQSPTYAWPYSAARTLPAVFFMAAAWAASTALLRMDRGDASGDTMARMLKWIGGSMMLGAVAAIVVQPSFVFLFTNGFAALRGVVLQRMAEHVAIGLVGLALLLFARRGQTLPSNG